MQGSVFYKNWVIVAAVLSSVILGTFIGTPHTLADPILYLKTGFNVIIGILIWGYYYLISSRLDRSIPWSDSNSLKRWIIQLGIALPIGITVIWFFVLLRDSWIGWPTSTHLFFYTDVPILIFLSLGIMIFYRNRFLTNRPDGNNAKATTISIQNGTKTEIVTVSDIAYAYRRNELNFIRLLENRDLITDQSLNAISELPGFREFFRVNRKLLVAKKAVKAYRTNENRQTHITLEPEFNGDNSLNKNRLREFKIWMGG